jgi:DMSO/TMAO reductase YedYZ heme-binding membrane subunit
MRRIGAREFGGNMLKSKALNEWNLFWLLALPVSAVVIIAMTGADLSSGEGVSSMIQFSVRCAVPWLYLAFAASSLYALFPGEPTRWLLRNRKIMGLCFAAAMAWQGLFILWMVTLYSDYYVNEVYVLRDVIEGLLGYLLLIAMTITTFKVARRRVRPEHWRWLHKTGIYFLWAYAFSVYWYELFYYEEITWIDYVYYWAGFFAFALRVAAWVKKSWQMAARNSPDASAQPALVAMGALLVASGLVGAVFGSSWGDQADQLLTGYAITQWLELYFPYYAPVPFLPPFALALGGFLVVKSRKG